MSNTTGNKFWQARTKHGKDKLFTSPDILWDACVEYFEWVEQNPLIEEKVAQYQGEPVSMQVNKMRAMTMMGLCTFLDIGTSTWADYRSREGYEDYSEVVKRVEAIIYDQKFSGAAADLLNSNIIARDLGLADKKDADITSGGRPINEWHIHPVAAVNGED